MSNGPQDEHDERPSIVLFARHFPPHISGGARRPYYLATALSALGCKVFVVAPALPDGVEGVAVPHVQPDPAPGARAKLGLRGVLRDWLLWPDPDIRWTKRAVLAAKSALPFKPDWVITTSPPESIHHAGYVLKAAYGCYWYADFRDHWLVRPFRAQRKNRLRNFVEGRIARRWLGAADLISVVNDAIDKEIGGYAGAGGSVFTLPHFAIESDVEAVMLDHERLNLVHTGSFSLSDPECDINQTLDVFTRALAKNPKLHLHLAGRLTQAEEKCIAASAGAHAITRHGVVSMPMAHALQNAAQGLILAASPFPDTPPGKAAEYATRNKPIIAITTAAWANDYNGSKTAEECMVGTGKDTPIAPQNPLPNQYEIAEDILTRMGKKMGG